MTFQRHLPPSFLPRSFVYRFILPSSRKPVVYNPPSEALPLHALPRLILKIKEEFAHADLRQIRARGKSHYFSYLTIIPRGFVLIGDNHS